MIEYIKTDHPDYVRDPYSKALIYDNRKAVDEYTMKKKMLEGLKHESERINNLEDKVNEVISLFKELINRLDNK